MKLKAFPFTLKGAVEDGGRVVIFHDLRIYPHME
jgi:hypothetical protein